MLLRKLCFTIHGVSLLTPHIRTFSASFPAGARLRPLPLRRFRPLPPSPSSPSPPPEEPYVRGVTDFEGTLRNTADCLAKGKIWAAQARVKRKLTSGILNEHKDEKGEPLYRQLAEGAIELFLSWKYIDGAEMVLKTIKDLGNEFPLPLNIRAKLLACRYANKVISRALFLENLKNIFVQNKFILNSVPGDFHGIIQHLPDVPDPLSTLEKVAAMYIQAKSAHGEFHLDGISIAFLIQQSFLAGKYKRARHWLGEAKHLINSDDAFKLIPYKTYLKRNLQILRDTDDPEDEYGPHLQRMDKHGAKPDIELVNMLLKAELAPGRITRFFAIYEKLRNNGFDGVFPDENTFQIVFEAYTEKFRRTVYPIDADAPDFMKEVPEESETLRSPRQVFWDLINSINPNGPASSGNSAITSNSLSSALLYFVHATDYAAALIVLRMVVRLDCAFEDSQIKLVLDALVERCRRELLELPGTKKRVLSDDGRGVAWVDVFLSLQETTKRKVKRESMAETAKRVVSVAKRAVALAQLDIEKRAATESDEGGCTSKSRPLEAAKGTSIEQDHNDSAHSCDNSSEHRNTSQAGPDKQNLNGNSASSSDPTIMTEGRGPERVEQVEQTTQSLRQEKLMRMHERRIEIIDVLLSRALATECFLDGSQNPSQDGTVAIDLAGEEMIPDLSPPERPAGSLFVSPLKLYR